MTVDFIKTRPVRRSSTAQLSYLPRPRLSVELRDKLLQAEAQDLATVPVDQLPHQLCPGRQEQSEQVSRRSTPMKQDPIPGVTV